MNDFLIDLNFTQLNTFYIISNLTLIATLFWSMIWLFKAFDFIYPKPKSILFFVFIFVAFFPAFTGIYLYNKVFTNPSDYSEQELGNFSLRNNGDFYQIESQKVNPIGEVSLITNYKFKRLGKINCGEFSFRECVDLIKKNKSQITSQIQGSGFFAMNDFSPL